jgi:hypothetical protein
VSAVIFALLVKASASAFVYVRARLGARVEVRINRPVGPDHRRPGCRCLSIRRPGENKAHIGGRGRILRRGKIAAAALAGDFRWRNP